LKPLCKKLLRKMTGIGGGIYNRAGIYHRCGLDPKDRSLLYPSLRLFQKMNFLILKAKYEGASEEITPANVEESVAEKVRVDARRAYSVFNCKGIVRMDFIYDEKSGYPFLLEINTVPVKALPALYPSR
jgi:D-alanine-D-alanine ligase